MSVASIHFVGKRFVIFVTSVSFFNMRFVFFMRVSFFSQAFRLFRWGFRCFGEGFVVVVRISFFVKAFLFFMWGFVYIMSIINCLRADYACDRKASRHFFRLLYKLIEFSTRSASKAQAHWILHTISFKSNSTIGVYNWQVT